MKAERPPGAFDTPIAAFLSRARRRYLAREILGAAFVSAALDILLGLAVGWVNLTCDRALPGVSIGVVLFLLIVAVSLRRNRVEKVAARTDRRLRLQDRLATYLDFGGREDVDRDFRTAQAGEAAAALARTDLARGLPVPRLLWAAPLFFAWMLYVEYFPFLVTFTSPVRQQATLVSDPYRVATRPGDPTDDTAVRDKRAEAPALKEPQKDEASPAPEEPAPAAGSGHPPPAGSEPAADAGFPDAGPAAALSPQARVPAMIGEPARLFSEQVSATLTPLADPASGTVFNPPAEAPQHPSGRISFNLIPVDSGADGPPGIGGKPGGGKAAGLEITVDYDAVPPEYRPHVRRYFEALVRMFQGVNQNPG